MKTKSEQVFFLNFNEFLTEKNSKKNSVRVRFSSVRFGHVAYLDFPQYDHFSKKFFSRFQIIFKFLESLKQL